MVVVALRQCLSRNMPPSVFKSSPNCDARPFASIGNRRVSNCICIRTCLFYGAAMSLAEASNGATRLAALGASCRGGVHSQ